MRHARPFALFMFVACSGAAVLRAQSSSPTGPASAAPSAPDISINRTLIDESNKARAAGDYDSARAMALEVVTYLLARPAAEQDAAWLVLLESAGSAADDAQDSRTAKAAWMRVCEVLSAALPADHADLQRARNNLALTLFRLGDLSGARALQERVFEVFSRTLPDDDHDLQAARGNLAETLKTLGDFAGARALHERVLEVFSRTLPDDHPDLQKARHCVANMLYTLGDLAGARALQEKVLEVSTRTLPAYHFELQSARTNLALTLFMLGDVPGARALQEKALEVCSRTLPDGHPDLQRARGNLANTLFTLGDLAGARALEERVLEVFSRTLPDDDPTLQVARMNHANTLYTLGDLAGARALHEKVLEVFSRTLPNDKFDLQLARMNLAGTLYSQGDLAGARALFERVLEAFLRTLPDEHPALQMARRDLANTLVGQFVRKRRSPAVEGEKIGEAEGATGRCAELIGDLCRAQVNAARTAILASPSREAEERCTNLAQTLDVSLSFAQGLGVFEPLRALESGSFILAETTRGAAIVSAELTRRAARDPKYEELRGALRAASNELAGLAQKGTTSEEFDRVRVKRESVERDLVALARELSGGQESGVQFDVESLAGRLAEREAAVGFRRFTKRWVEVLDELDSTGQPTVRDVSTDSLCAFVVRSSKAAALPDSAHDSSPTFVDLGPLEPIEAATRAWREGLGVASDSRGIAASAHEQPASSAHMQGTLLREHVFDPLLPALNGVQHIVVVLDDVLHLVPLDALPLDEKTLIGDQWQVETRTTLTELLLSREPFEDAGELVAIGDVDYETIGVGDGASNSHSSAATTALSVAEVKPHAMGGESRAGDDNSPAGDTQPPTARLASILRGGAWSHGFSALPGTGVEVRGIARCFADQFGEDSALKLCEHASATRAQLLALAPNARYLHIATHGWFAPQSIKSWSDPEPLDKQSGLGARMSGAEQVKGMSPMLLCGLALAGANLPENAVGRTPGLVTADELSTLDLSNCELVVLSACDTNVGERRAGQGVASLQKALQMAGARSVITSLWKVPDEATKELMLDFYRRLWVEKKPKSQALWEAKTKLREAKDERGMPKYTTRDWAAWVLTGEPR